MTQSESERQMQMSYWKEHSGEATVEAMMLDSKAADIDKLERPEARSLPIAARWVPFRLPLSPLAPFRRPGSTCRALTQALTPLLL